MRTWILRTKSRLHLFDRPGPDRVRSRTDRPRGSYRIHYHQHEFTGDDVRSTSVEDAQSASHETRDKIVLRPMRSGDLPRISAFRDVVGWVSDPDSFEVLRGINDVRWALAEDVEAPGHIVGMVGAVPLGEIGVMCHLAVRREYREYGTGMKLAAWAVAYLKSRGAKTIRLFSTLQAEGVYRSLGFEAGPARNVYRREAGAFDFSGHVESGAYRVETLRFADLPELFGVDHWSFGGERSHLILATLRLHPGLGLVARDRLGTIRGYLVRSTSKRQNTLVGDVTRIGPLMASDAEVAGVLLHRALGPETAFEVVTPGGSATSDEAHLLFTGAGFEGREDRRIMELGDETEQNGGLRAFATTAYLAT